MAVIQPRDKEAIEFIQRMNVATTSQIERACYGGNNQVARRRLNAIMGELEKMGDRSINRYQPDISSQYIYYTGRKQPGRADHSIIVTEVYVRLLALPGRIEVWELEPDWGPLRPDAFCVFEVRPGLFVWFSVEVERLTGNPFNQKKYEEYRASKKWMDKFAAFPRVLIVTDKKVRIHTTDIRFTIVPTSLTGIEEIIK